MDADDYEVQRNIPVRRTATATHHPTPTPELLPPDAPETTTCARSRPKHVPRGCASSVPDPTRRPHGWHGPQHAPKLSDPKVYSNETAKQRPREGRAGRTRRRSPRGPAEAERRGPRRRLRRPRRRTRRPRSPRRKCRARRPPRCALSRSRAEPAWLATCLRWSILPVRRTPTQQNLDFKDTTPPSDIETHADVCICICLRRLAPRFAMSTPLQTGENEDVFRDSNMIPL